jgi:hypothetical protein
MTIADLIADLPNRNAFIRGVELERGVLIVMMTRLFQSSVAGVPQWYGAITLPSMYKPEDVITDEQANALANDIIDRVNAAFAPDKPEQEAAHWQELQNWLHSESGGK